MKPTYTQLYLTDPGVNPARKSHDEARHSAEPKTTIDLPFSPEDVLAGRVKNDVSLAKFDKAWEIIRDDPELALARQRLSIHELRHIIRAVAKAFS